MYPQTPNINVDFTTLDLIGRPCYRLNEIDNNPTLQVVRGKTYLFKVNVPAAHRFWIKSEINSSSLGAYFNGVVNNGSSLITWRVPDNAPDRLVYQSQSSTLISGSIQVLNSPPGPNSALSFKDVISRLTFLEQSLIYSPQELAGPGLVQVGESLALAQAGLRFLEDTTGQLYTSQTNFTVNDNAAVVSDLTTLDLQGWLDLIATQLKQLKGTPAYNTPTSETLASLKERIDNLTFELNYLASQIN